MKFRSLFIVVIIFSLSTVCHSENHVINLRTTFTNQTLTVIPHISFETSEQIKEAIDNGVRIQLIVKAQVIEPHQWWFDKTIENKKTTLEVFYFTLGKLYVVKDKETGEQLGFNDYDQIWTEFEKLIKFEFLKPDINGRQVKLRIMLDKNALPTVMQLPVLFNSNWDINTPWFDQEIGM